MKVRDLMQKHVVSVRPDDDLALAAQVMAWSSIRHLPVVARGRVVGILSERDVVDRSARHGPSLPVEEAMTTGVDVLNPNEDITGVPARLTRSGVGCLPVVEGDTLVGIVTSTDLVANLARQAFSARPSEGTKGQLDVSDIMTSPVESVGMDDLLIEAAARMSRRGIRHLPVVDDEGHVIGMLSDRDLRAVLGDLVGMPGERFAQRIDDTRVGDVASVAPIAVRESASLDDVISLLLDHRIGAVPVVDDIGKLVGIVSYVDVLARTQARSTGTEESETAGERPPPAIT